MPKIDLLPCPFCGETDLHLESFSGFGADVVICRGCLATFSQQEITCEEDLIKAWNTRASGWIPCSDRMPKEDGEYLCVSNGEFKILPYRNGEFYCTCFDAVLRCCNSSVTRWMPLPDNSEAEDKT